MFQETVRFLNHLKVETKNRLRGNLSYFLKVVIRMQECDKMNDKKFWQDDNYVCIVLITSAFNYAPFQTYIYILGVTSFNLT